MRRLRGLAATLVLIVVLAGCAPQPALTADGAARLQEDVASVTDAAAAGDLAGAVAALGRLRTTLEDATGDKQVSPERAAEIDAVISVLHKDLEAAIAAAQAEAERAAAIEEQRRAAEEQRLAAEEMQRRLDQLQAELERQSSSGNGNGNSGNGNSGNGNPGKGNSGRDDDDDDDD